MNDTPPPENHYEWNVSSIKSQAFEYMDQLEGWCSKEKASFVIDLILKNRPEIIVEVGVFGGKSLIPMAVAQKAAFPAGVTFGVDPWDPNQSIEEVMNEETREWWLNLNYEEIFQGVQGKLTQFGLEKTVVLLRTTSEEAPPIQGIGVLHIDGNHSDKTSFFDVTKWVPLMKKGGWVIFDDMTWFENGQYTTAKAVDWLDKNCARFAHFKEKEGEWGVWCKL